MLIGSLSKNLEKYSVNLSVCLICDVATHCTLTYQSDITENVSADSVPDKNPESNSLDLKSSSHSSMQKILDAKGKYCSCIFVNNKKMLFNVSIQLYGIGQPDGVYFRS